MPAMLLRLSVLAMLLAAPGGDSLEWLQANSGLSTDEFEEAFTQLLDFSLVERNRAQASPVFYLHRITQTFLKTNILQEWNE